jgi:hypothetical protein
MFAPRYRAAKDAAGQLVELGQLFADTLVAAVLSQDPLKVLAGHCHSLLALSEVVLGARRERNDGSAACRAAGVPTFSPHDRRHRRVSLLNAQGLPWGGSGSRSPRRPVTTARTYTHVLVSEDELDYERMLR